VEGRKDDDKMRRVRDELRRIEEGRGEEGREKVLVAVNEEEKRGGHRGMDSSKMLQCDIMGKRLPFDPARMAVERMCQTLQGEGERERDGE
jgi:hypothetical protein